MTNKTFFSLFIVFILFSNSCKKDKVECTPQKAPHDFLDYWYFPVGSWWVYQLNNTGIYDTVTVAQNREFYENDREKSCANDYESYLNHSNYMYFPFTTDSIVNNQIFHGYSATGPPFQKWYLLYDGGSNYYQGWESGPISYPFDKDKYESNIMIRKDTIYKFINKDTILVVYHITPIFYTTPDSLKRDYIKDLYFSKNVGIIKKVYTNNQTWALVNFEIKQ